MALALSCAVFVGCVSPPPPPALPSAGPVELAPPPLDQAPLSPPLAFEQRQRERALGFARQKRLADAAIAWEVLAVLRPDLAEYRERLADAQRQIDAAVTERLPRAVQSAQRGDIEQATRHYLAVLALQPHNEPAADALRALERERNKRNYLGKSSRVTLTRRAMAEAEMPINGTPMALSNEVEHAALLAGEGEFDDAIAMLERRLATERRDAAARRLLANVYYRKAESLLPRDRSAAVSALQKSARLDPAEPRAAARLKQLKGTAGVPASADVMPAR